MKQGLPSPAWRFQGGGRFILSEMPVLGYLLLLLLAAGPVDLHAFPTALPAQQQQQADASEPPVEESVFPEVDLPSPREAMRVFLQNMRAEREGDRGSWRYAAATLSLDHLSAIALESRARQITTELYEIINRLVFVDLDDVPGEEWPTDEWLFRDLDAGDITLVRGDDGQWRFSRETIEAIPALFQEIRDRPLVEGAPTTRFIDSPTAWFRTHLPHWLFERTIILENFQWFGLFLVILLGSILDRVIRFLMERVLRHRFRDDDYDYNSEYLRALAKWTGISIGAFAWVIGMSWLGLPEMLYLILRIAAVLLATMAGVLALLKVVDLFALTLEKKTSRTGTKMDDLLVPLLRKTLKVFIVVFGIVIVADNLDVNITGVIAGLGLGGLAFALAAKDTVENLFGSITILLDRPFHIGDWIEMETVEGTVEAIGFRSTRVRTFYDSLVTIPNSNLIKAKVDNYGARRRRRVRCFLSITYNTPPEKVDAFCEGIREIIRRHPYTAKVNYHVWFNQFGSHSLDILLYMFHEVPDWATELRERHRLFLDIMRLAKRLGVEFAFPTQTLYLERGQGPARPSDAPYEPWNTITRTNAETRREARDLVDVVHRSGGAPFPPPPVRFDMPLEEDTGMPLMPRNRGGSSGGEDAGSGEAGSR